MSLGEAGGQADRLEIGGPRLGIALERPESVAQVMVQARDSRLKADGFLAMG